MLRVKVPGLSATAQLRRTACCRVAVRVPLPTFAVWIGNGCPSWHRGATTMERHANDVLVLGHRVGQLHSGCLQHEDAHVQREFALALPFEASHLVLPRLGTLNLTP